MRRQNPDLIFKDELEERATRVSELYGNWLISPDSVQLDRITLFATHRCNLFCKYCNGPHMNKKMDEDLRREMLASDFSLDLYEKLMVDWVKHRARHIHFTGGECTLNPDLPEFIRLATENSILTTITTNGTADIELYKTLIRNGLGEIRISLDSTEPKYYDEMTGVSGTTERIKRNIKELIRFRKESGLEFFVVINTCISRFNLGFIKHTIDSMLSLGTDDVKLLAIAEDGREICSKGTRELVDDLLDYVRKTDKDYRLLEKKVRLLFRRNTFGLDDRSVKNVMKNCYIPLTERTLDSRFFYPCSIYLRYGGEPLAPVTATYQEQQVAIRKFVERNDCKQDGICKRYCTNCCKVFNLETSRKIRLREKKLSAALRSTIIVKNPEVEHVDRIITELERINNINITKPHPYLIIKPSGIEYLEEILRYLHNQGVYFEDKVDINNWGRYSFILYLKNPNPEKIRFKLALTDAYNQSHNWGRAMLLKLEPEVPEKKLLRIKREIRDWFGEELRFWQLDNHMHLLKDSYLHTPDYRDLELENKKANYLLQMKLF